MLATAMGGDEGTYVEEQLLIMERNGYPEETYYTFSYSPIPDDDGTSRRHHLRQHRRHPARHRRAAAGSAARTGGRRTATRAPGRMPATARRRALAVQSARHAVRADLHGRARTTMRCGSDRRRGIDAGTSGMLRTMSTLDEQRLLADRRGAADHQQTPGRFGPRERIRRQLCRPEAGASHRTDAAIVPILPAGETGRAGALIVGLNPFRLFDDALPRFPRAGGGPDRRRDRQCPGL